jgi:hypothetical protein
MKDFWVESDVESLLDEIQRNSALKPGNNMRAP